MRIKKQDSFFEEFSGIHIHFASVFSRSNTLLIRQQNQLAPGLRRSAFPAANNSYSLCSYLEHLSIIQVYLDNGAWSIGDNLRQD